MLFVEPVYLQKLPLTVGDLDPHVIHGSFGPHETACRRASRSVQPFLHSVTNRQTDHATLFVAIGHIAAVVWPNNETTSKTLQAGRSTWA